MIKRKIAYVDYDGNPREEEFYFNLSEAEILEMELTTTGGLEQMIRNIIAAQDTPRLVTIFKDLVLRAYGVKSPDGRRFIKTEELKKEFEQTEAYSKLFVELATNDKAAADFVNGVIEKPKEKTAASGSNLVAMPTM